MSSDPYDLIRDDLAKIQKFRQLENDVWVAEVTANEEMKAILTPLLAEAKAEAVTAYTKFANIVEVLHEDLG
jgi:hypothetical protein